MIFGMKLLRIISLCALSLLSLKCSIVESEISGIWQLENSENCNRIFLGLTPFIDPYAKYGHKIYISDSLFYNPSMKEEGLPFDKKYNIKGKQILLDGIGQIEFTRRGSILVFEKEGCKLKFMKQIGEETLPKNSLSKIIFNIQDEEEEVLVDSLHLQRAGRTAHVFRIAESIEIKNLNRQFDEGVSDTNKHTIILQLYNGKSYQIVSYGKYETPFEIKTLLKYLLDEV